MQVRELRGYRYVRLWAFPPSYQIAITCIREQWSKPASRTKPWIYNENAYRSFLKYLRIQKDQYFIPLGSTEVLSRGGKTNLLIVIEATEYLKNGFILYEMIRHEGALGFKSAKLHEVKSTGDERIGYWLVFSNED